METAYSVRRFRNSRRLRIAVHGDGSVTVSAPLRASEDRIREAVASHKTWIERTVEKFRKRTEGLSLFKETVDRKEFSREVGNLIDEKAREIGVRPRKVSVRKMRSRWGSCSREGNISINLLLGHLPPPLLEYVVIHELCHIVHHNHSRAFWSVVERYISDYKAHKKLLRRYGYLLRQG